MPNPLDIIAQRESGGKNVPNYKYGPGFSASGYYQIINATWRRWAQAAGIDISQYPTAMSAPKEVQDAVARQGFKMEGFRPWEATKHLVGQERNYSLDEPQTQVAGLLGNASPVTKDGVSVPVAAPVVQRAKDIDEFRRLMSEKFPQLRYTSGYRSPSYNQKVGGAKASQHTHNLAVDVGLKEYDPATQRAIVEYARTIGAQGLGYYPGSQSAHFDLRTGAPKAWGANYSRTSLPGTPKWFQEVAQSHLSGAATPPTAVASGGPAGGTMGSAGAGGPAPAPAPTPLTPMQNIAGGLSKIAKAMQPAPLEVAHPMQDAPVADNPRQDQGGAANLMAQLLEQQRERYTPQQPQQPGIFDTGVFA